MNPAIPWFTAGLVILAAALLLLKPLLFLLRILLRSSAALLLLTCLQKIGGLFGITLGANLGNALVLGLLGIPGFGLLLMIQWLLRS